MQETFFVAKLPTNTYCKNMMIRNLLKIIIRIVTHY